MRYAEAISILAIKVPLPVSIILLATSSREGAKGPVYPVIDAGPLGVGEISDDPPFAGVVSLWGESHTIDVGVEGHLVR